MPQWYCHNHILLHVLIPEMTLAKWDQILSMVKELKGVEFRFIQWENAQMGCLTSESWYCRMAMMVRNMPSSVQLYNPIGQGVRAKSGTKIWLRLASSIMQLFLICFDDTEYMRPPIVKCDRSGTQEGECANFCSILVQWWRSVGNLAAFKSPS
jgi:hypothetical protein